VPDPCRADKIGIFSERSQGKLGLFEWDKTAAAANYLADAVEKQDGALHYAATQDDHVGREQIDEIGQTKTQVEGLSFDGLASQNIALLREFADALAVRCSRCGYSAGALASSHATIAGPAANDSQQPRKPQEQSGPDGSMT
jgi:hypothetical protein